MLQSLRVRNFAIVESLDVDFAAGLNVITGETGAGKSVIVGALGLLLGMRADRTQVRAGAEQCQVEAVFALDDTRAVAPLLEELGISPCDDGALIIRRTVTAASGAGKCLVNDSATTVQALKRLGDLLVDLHGPHEHQSLLNPDFQLDLLDAFGRLEAERAAYHAPYESMLAIDRRRRDLQGDERTIAQQIDMLAFQVKEIEAAKLDALNEETLAAEHALLANAQEILALGQSAVATLTEDETSAFSRLVDGRRLLDAIARLTPEAQAWEAEAECLATGLQALSTTLQRRLQDIELDPERLQQVEERIGLIHKLKRKYGGSIADIQAFLASARTSLDDLSSRTERLAALDKEYAAAQRAMLAAGRALSTKRRKAGQSLARAVVAHLKELGFPHGDFAAEPATNDAEPRPSGLDSVDFGFAPNVGEPMRPLRVIASSGEISRVMLATKAVLAEHDRVPVLVFDEVDANVGGEMGVAIGSKLKTIAARHQVLCITHLPQVAAHGDAHFAVAKRVGKGRTYTEIAPVTGAAREEEVARMLGGKDLTTVTLRHARELLART